MSFVSLIEWTDTTWNPVRGCSKVSPGCLNCYAQKFAERFRGTVGHPFEQGFDLRLAPWKLLEPFQWAHSRVAFVNSMSDLFHEGVPDDFIVSVFEVMAEADWHTYQVLTKRSARMNQIVSDKLRFATGLDHIWWGATIENKKHGLPRIELLRDTPVAHRFLSCEPLLEDLGHLNLDAISWVIAGGESGPGARPMEESWALSIRDQCAASEVPFFFKQWGGFPKSKHGCLLDGQEHKETPCFRLPVAIPLEERRARRALFQGRFDDLDRAA